jgi:hypothetical protein
MSGLLKNGYPFNEVVQEKTSQASHQSQFILGTVLTGRFGAITFISPAKISQ